jgi:hypothetical protein
MQSSVAACIATTAPAMSSTPVAACEFYLAGKCVRGNKCTYSHDSPGVAAKDAAAAAAAATAACGASASAAAAAAGGARASAAAASAQATDDLSSRIKAIEQEIKEAKEAGAPWDHPAVAAMRTQLAGLQEKENLLLKQQAGEQARGHVACCVGAWTFRAHSHARVFSFRGAAVAVATPIFSAPSFLLIGSVCSVPYRLLSLRPFVSAIAHMCVCVCVCVCIVYVVSWRSPASLP